MEDNQEKKFSEDKEKINGNVVKQISTEKIFWNSILEFLMEFSDTRIYQWIKAHPQLSIALIIIWGLMIMGMFFTFIIFILMR